MAALKLSSLRTLVRLHRDGVDGTEVQLEALIDEDPDRLTRLINVPGQDVRDIQTSPDRVDVLVDWVTHATRRRSEHQARAQREHAVSLAREVAVRWPHYDEAHLDLERLDELVSLRSFAWMFFDPNAPLGFERVLLKRILRGLRSATVHDAILRPEGLHLGYSTPRSRGRFDLKLQALPRDKERLYVPAFEGPSRAAQEPDPAPGAGRAREPHRETLRRFFERLSEGVP
jgi:hypothetical protein